MANKNEVWKTVVGFDGIYKISSHGRIWAKPCIRYLSNGRGRRFNGKFTGSWPKNGYPWVVLWHPKTQARRNVTIHLLVVETFLGPKPSPKHEVNHKDGNKHNPKLENLEWVTHADNCNHAYKNGLKDNYARYVEFEGQRMRVADWARKLNVRPQNIYARLDKGYSIEAALDKTSRLAREIGNKKISNATIERRPKYKDGLDSTQWAKKLGITQQAFLWRIRHYIKNEQIYYKGYHPKSGTNLA